MITNGHDLIRNWASILKPHPAHSPLSSSTGRKGRSGVRVGGGYYAKGGGTSASKRFQQKKMRGMGKGF